MPHWLHVWSHCPAATCFSARQWAICARYTVIRFFKQAAAAARGGVVFRQTASFLPTTFCQLQASLDPNYEI